MATYDEEYIKKAYPDMVSAGPKPAPRPVVREQYNDPFMANAQEYVDMYNQNVAPSYATPKQRQEYAGPVTQSEDFRYMRRYAPDRPSEWERENQLRDARFDSWIVHDRGPMFQQELAKAGIAAQREAALRAQWAQEDQNYYGSMGKDYGVVNDALQSRNQTATAADIARNRDIAATYQQALSNSGYGYGTDANARNAMLAKLREKADELNLPQSVTNGDPAALSGAIDSKQREDLTPQVIMPGYADPQATQKNIMPLPDNSSFWEKLYGSTLGRMGSWFDSDANTPVQVGFGETYGITPQGKVVAIEDPSKEYLTSMERYTPTREQADAFARAKGYESYGDLLIRLGLTSE